MSWSRSRLNTVLLLGILALLVGVFATRAYGGALDRAGHTKSHHECSDAGVDIVVVSEVRDTVIVDDVYCRLVDSGDASLVLNNYDRFGSGC